LKADFFGVMPRTESVEQAALGGVITRGSVNAVKGHPGRLDRPKSKGLENAILMASRGVPGGRGIPPGIQFAFPALRSGYSLQWLYGGRRTVIEDSLSSAGGWS
jgi:hypothetical protein